MQQGIDLAQFVRVRQLFNNLQLSRARLKVVEAEDTKTGGLNSTGTVDSELDGTLVGVKQLDSGLG
jgi:hypothetical protein